MRYARKLGGRIQVRASTSFMAVRMAGWGLAIEGYGIVELGNDDPSRVWREERGKA